MKKFTVIFCAPVKGMEEWMKMPVEERKDEEQKMRAAWGEWTKAHGSVIADGGTALGTNARVTKDGAAEMKNDMMLYTTFQAESRDELTKILSGHPHFGIPGAYMEVMEARAMGMTT